MKKNINLIIPIIIFFIISISSIYSSLSYLTTSMHDIFYKQIIFYVLGFIIIILLNKIGIKKLLSYAYLIYGINILLLVLVLLFGKEVNGSRAWFQIPYLGSFQPSEFMKIGLILILAKIIDDYKNNNKSDIKLIIKILILVAIPSILTFLEPDTGAVIIYFIIAIIMLFSSGLKNKWFILGIIFIISILAIVFYLYFYEADLFIEIIGNNFFYRLDRIFDWTTKSGMQLENSMISISSSGLFGHGFNQVPIYFPEPQTDFIFATFTSNFGLFGAIILIITIIYFDLTIINIALKQKKDIYKYILSGFLGVIYFGQFQNIAMTIGITPIMGITLPFISYGGSSLLSYMIILGIIFSINEKK